MSEKANVHKDHRSRLKRRYESEGMGAFEDHNVLELLLFYAIPRKDTNPIAHRLLERFGSLHGVFEASEKELCEVDGIGPAAASFLAMCPRIAARVVKERLESEPFNTGARLGQYFVDLFRFEPIDAACVLFLDDALRFVSLEMLQNGRIDAPRDVVDKTAQIAGKKRASYAVLAHNHKDTGTSATPADISSTNDVRSELSSLGVHLIAHFIVSGYDYENFMDERHERKEFRNDL